MITYDEDNSNLREGALGETSHCEAEERPAKPSGPSRTPVANRGGEEVDLLFDANVISDQIRNSKENSARNQAIANEQRSRREGKSRRFIPTLAQSLSYAQIVKQQAKPTPQAHNQIRQHNIFAIMENHR